jgi:cysteine desulfurase
VKSAVEKARKQVAQFLNAAPSEIFFTSGGTESDNTALRCAVASYGIKHVVSSKMEHHAVLHTLEELEHEGKITLTFLSNDEKGQLDLNELDEILQKNPNSLVSLMHGNNEIGNITDIEAVGHICEKNGALFHTDTVQTLGHFPIDLSKIKAHFIAGSAHKFHGPKGTGILYIRGGTKIRPFQTGGAQERNMRGGTENVAGIIGLAKALEISVAEMQIHREHILSLKKHLISELKALFPDIRFNGLSEDLDKSLYTVLNVSFPPSEINDMLLFNLDIHKICASAGSACSSGSQIGSHVLAAIKADPKRGAVRFSFGKYNTHEDIDCLLSALKEIFKVTA